MLRFDGSWHSRPPQRRRCPSGWYRNGEDPKRRLPILSTYLGHAHVTDTYWYLTGTPELLGAAGKRLEKRWEGLNAGLPLIFLPCCSRSSRRV